MKIKLQDVAMRDVFGILYEMPLQFYMLFSKKYNAVQRNKIHENVERVVSDNVKNNVGNIILREIKD